MKAETEGSNISPKLMAGTVHTFRPSLKNMKTGVDSILYSSNTSWKEKKGLDNVSKTVAPDLGLFKP